MHFYVVNVDLAVVQQLLGDQSKTEVNFMTDILSVVFLLFSFGAAIAFVLGCEKLK